MKEKQVIYCNPDETRFNWEGDPKALPRKLKDLGRVRVTFEKYVPMKSLPQLGYYRGGILPFLEKVLFDNTGVTRDEWHTILKQKCGKRRVDKTGCIEVIVSHADYLEKDMSEFISKVKQWVWGFFQVQIPEPNSIERWL